MATNDAPIPIMDTFVLRQNERELILYESGEGFLAGIVTITLGILSVPILIIAGVEINNLRVFDWPLFTPVF